MGGLGVGSAQDRDLVAKDEQLDVFGGWRAAEQHQPIEESIEDQVEETQRHIRDHAVSSANSDHCR
jgi:hypothetical protein